jgi:hypothetical protein
MIRFLSFGSGVFWDRRQECFPGAPSDWAQFPQFLVDPRQVRKLAVRADPDNSNSGAARFTGMAIRAPPFTKLTSGISLNHSPAK